MNRPTSTKAQHVSARPLRSGSSTERRRAGLEAPTVKTIVAATAAALMLLPQVRDAQAQVIGDIDVRSRIGERFFAAVPVQSERVLDPNCIQVSRNPAAPQGAEPLSATRVRINPTGAVESVIIETAGPVTNALVALRLQVGCVSPVVRDFVVRTESAPVMAEAPAVVPARVAPRPQRAPAPRAAPRAAPAAQTAQASAPQPAAIASQAAPVPPRAATAAIPKPQPAARGDESAPKAPVVTGHSTPVPATAAGAPAPAAPLSLADQEAQKRISELRARSDDHAANLLALEDRLSILQKQAELLKAQLEQTMSSPAPASQSDASAAPVASAAPTAAAATGASTTRDASIVAAQPAAKARSVGDLITDWRVIGGALGGLLIAALGYGFGRRKPVEPEHAAPAAVFTRQRPMAHETASTAPRFDRTQEMQAPPTTPLQVPEWREATHPMFADETAQWETRPPTTTTMAVPEGGVPQSAIITQPGVGITRDFHITQQFQPTNERAVALSTPDEIVQQARTHYMDDGDTFRAIDLLEMAVSVRSDSTRPWQALFAIYRRESMSERFQRLAVAYRQAFGEDSNWPAIQGLGHAMDPSNPLYAGAEGAPPPAADLLDRWLGVPLDFTAHLLANEMHDQLMETFPGRGKKRVSGE